MVLLAGLQFRLWVGEGSLAHQFELDTQIDEQRDENQRLKRRNEKVAQEVESLKTNLESIEEKARTDLGMIKEGEIFYLVIDKNDAVLNSKPKPDNVLEQNPQ
jgi:cell division protein FtsB